MPKRDIPVMEFDASSSDEAPEEISASSSRQLQVSKLKNIKEVERRNKEEEKDRRRQRNEMFRIQKEKKLKDLSKRKLPQDVLDAVSAKLVKKDVTENKDSFQARDESDSEDEEDMQDLDKDSKDRLSDSGLDDQSDKGEEDFIPLGDSGKLVVVTQEALAKTRRSASEQIRNFKHSQLYNQCAIPRETAKQKRAKMAKRNANRQRL